ELRGTWTDTVVDGGRPDTLILNFTAWLEDDRLVGWQVELRTDRSASPVRIGPTSASEPLTFDQRFSSNLVARGVLRCLSLSPHTAFVEAAQFSYGFEDAPMRTLLGRLAKLHAAQSSSEPAPVDTSIIGPPVTEPPPLVPGPERALARPARTPASIIEPAATRSGELFPYVYMSLWPAPAPAELALGFVRYPYPLDAAPSGALVQALAGLRLAGGPEARGEMERAAVAYIASDAFVRPLDALPAAMQVYGELHRLASEAAGCDPGAVASEIFELLGMDPATAGAWLDSPAYIAELARVWQSWFALVIELGYDAPLRDALARVLVVDHLLRDLAGRGDAPPTVAALVALARATLVLPGGIFPLPPAGTAPSLSPPSLSPSLSPPGGTRIAPYAIGDLQMVQQRLVGYALGDIARVESVMAGERRESIHRRKTSVSQSVSRETTDDTRRKSTGRSLAMTSELSRAIADVLQTTSYIDNGLSVSYNTGTQPSTTLTGGWSVETQPGPNGPSQSEVTRAVRRVVERAADRVARRVIETRTTSRVESTEDEATSVLDNTAGSAPRRGIWRWLDEVYQATIVRYGNRLVFELLVADPAAGYTTREPDLPHSAYPPIPPPESFEHITRRGFPWLAARYPSEALVLPPPVRRTVSGWARSGAPLTLTVPDGYAARSAVVSYVVAPGGGTLEIRGVVGNATVELDVTATGTTTLPLAGELGAVQVLLLTCGPLCSPPVELEPVQLSVEITAELSTTAMDTWRLRTYQAIQAAYGAQIEAWHGHGGVDGAPGGSVQPRFGWRAVERRELLRGGLDLLFQTLHDHTGGDDGPSGLPRGVDFALPRQLQFFERCFEWRELSYRFFQAGPRRGRAAARLGGLGDDRFHEFLEADWAQLLVPVSPSEAMAVLYFLASGMLWDGDAARLPAHEADVALVSELKKLRPGPNDLRAVGEPWEVVVPTTISVLQDGGGTVAELCAPPKAPQTSQASQASQASSTEQER
ncbi:MAG TPA: hypothetical protein VH165_08375, partial [Kofleriaceae bacterium]|nr:hypothetical protein [Kofleriaceae bacterium]